MARHDRKTFGILLVSAVVWALGLAEPMLPQTRVSAAVSAAELTALKAVGSKSAPIVIEVFSDFQCPACKRVYQETLRPVMDNYVATGKVYLVHRDFPLPMHNHSREAARWANAAAAIGKFEKVEEALYSKQDTWSASGNMEAVVAAVLSPAEMKKVRQVMSETAMLDAAIDRDRELGLQKRVTQTPSLFVTRGAQTEALPAGGLSYSLLKQYLDYLLKQ